MSAVRDRVVLVTGASRGLGVAIARRFAVEGARLAITARTGEEGGHRFPGSLTTTTEELRSLGATVVPVVADLGVAADRARLADEVEAELGPVEVLVNNAAITYFEPVARFREDRYRLMFEVQVRAPFELVQRFLPGMVERHQGWILNISSGSARHPQGPPYAARAAASNMTVYGMCKAALERMTTGLAAEVYEHGVAVNVLSPSGLVATPGVVHHELTKHVPPEALEAPEVLAEAALALCVGDPEVLTGRVTYAKAILAELGPPVPGAAAP